MAEHHNWSAEELRRLGEKKAREWKATIETKAKTCAGEIVKDLDSKLPGCVERGLTETETSICMTLPNYRGDIPPEQFVAAVYAILDPYFKNLGFNVPKRRDYMSTYYRVSWKEPKRYKEEDEAFEVDEAFEEDFENAPPVFYEKESK